MNQCIAFIKSGKADANWIEEFGAFLDREVRNGHNGVLLEKIWKALLVVREEQVFLNGHSSDQRIEKIDRLIALLQDKTPPAGWLNEFERVFTEKRRMEEKDEQVQGRLLDLAVAADWRAIRLDPRRKGHSISRIKRRMSEPQYLRSHGSGEWTTSSDKRRPERVVVSYPLQDPGIRRRS